MGKRVVSVLLAVVMSTMLSTDCSVPTEAPTSNTKEGTRVTKDIKSSSSELSIATVLDADQLPITGTGAQIAASVKTEGGYTVDCITKDTTNPYIVTQLAGVEATGEVVGFTAIT